MRRADEPELCRARPLDSSGEFVVLLSSNVVPRRLVTCSIALLRIALRTGSLGTQAGGKSSPRELITIRGSLPSSSSLFHSMQTFPWTFFEDFLLRLVHS